MAQTRMFRDRVVSLEQTLEGGEKHLELLKSLCREALPTFDYREHSLNQERDLFVMTLAAPDGSRKLVCWTRMVLFDTERIPMLVEDPLGVLRARIVRYLRSQAHRPEIVVTFRHLEDGWVDTREARKEKKRRRRKGRRSGRARALGPQGPEAKASPPGRPKVPVGSPLPSLPTGSGAPSASRRRRRRFRRRGGRRPASFPSP